jgi:hypothetical protein
VAEQQREIEMERMKRQGKKVNMSIREYCTMCDLHFFGNLIVHRKNDRHQVLFSLSLSAAVNYHIGTSVDMFLI